MLSSVDGDSGRSFSFLKSMDEPSISQEADLIDAEVFTLSSAALVIDASEIHASRCLVMGG
jgi:hypothetical protein